MDSTDSPSRVSQRQRHPNHEARRPDGGGRQRRRLYPLTTGDQDAHRTGQTSTRLLLERINGRSEPEERVLTPRLVGRESLPAVTVSVNGCYDEVGSVQ